MRKLENETNKKWYDIFKQFCKTFQGFSSGMKKVMKKSNVFSIRAIKPLLKNHQFMLQRSSLFIEVYLVPIH